jgi:hypothetical protein
MSTRLPGLVRGEVPRRLCGAGACGLTHHADPPLSSSSCLGERRRFPPWCTAGTTAVSHNSMAPCRGSQEFISGIARHYCGVLAVFGRSSRSIARSSGSRSRNTHAIVSRWATTSGSSPSRELRSAPSSLRFRHRHPRSRREARALNRDYVNCRGDSQHRYSAPCVSFFGTGDRVSRQHLGDTLTRGHQSRRHSSSGRGSARNRPRRRALASPPRPAGALTTTGPSAPWFVDRSSCAAGPRGDLLRTLTSVTIADRRLRDAPVARRLLGFGGTCYGVGADGERGERSGRAYARGCARDIHEAGSGTDPRMAARNRADCGSRTVGPPRTSPGQTRLRTG